MTNNMAKIRALADELDRKQTEIKSGYRDMLKKINAELQGDRIETAEVSIEFFVGSWLNSDGSTSKVTLDLDIDDVGVRLGLWLGVQDVEGQYVWHLHEQPSLNMIKMVAAKLLEAIPFYIAHLSKLINVDDGVILMLQKIIAAVED